MGAKRQIEALIFSGHALRQMFAREIAVDEIKAVVDRGESVASYPDDRPHPSELLLGFAGKRPLHVVLAYNESAREGYRTKRKP
ncbi:MAG: DUF4258 domain-containing protein [Planctomycetes bacterium]|nr:DUF4258 domain-containing protein [Planctomycetota bacterium]